jgi:hypothetical protein
MIRFGAAVRQNRVSQLTDKGWSQMEAVRQLIRKLQKWSQFTTDKKIQKMEPVGRMIRKLHKWSQLAE